MSDNPIGTAPGNTPAGQFPVSPNNPCPFLRALVANGYVGGHVVPLAQLAEMIGSASGETGSALTKVRLEKLISSAYGSDTPRSRDSCGSRCCPYRRCVPLPCSCRPGTQCRRVDA